jgi:hypothetical protein
LTTLLFAQHDLQTIPDRDTGTYRNSFLLSQKQRRESLDLGDLSSTHHYSFPWPLAHPIGGLYCLQMIVFIHLAAVKALTITVSAVDDVRLLPASPRNINDVPELGSSLVTPQRPI